MKYTIEIIEDKALTERSAGTKFYIVKLNGETVLECLNERETKELTIEEILDSTKY